MANLYWIGGTGNWSDTDHWSATSGGSGGADVPTSSDDVFIDANSGFGSGGTITLDVDAVCQNITSSTGHTYTITDGTGTTKYIAVYGNVTLESGLTLLYQSFFLSADCTLTTNGCSLISLYLYDDGADYTVTLGSDLLCTDYFFAEAGKFDSNDFDVTAKSCGFVDTSNGYEPRIYMGSGTWTITGVADDSSWFVIGDDVVINAETSTLYIAGFSGGDSFFYGYNRTYYKIILGSGDGHVLHEGVYVDYPLFTTTDLEVEAGVGYVLFEDGGEVNLTNFITNATSELPLELDTLSGTGQFTLSKSSGTVECEYLDISNSVATGGATWIAKHSIDSGNNTGWIFGEPAFVTKSTLLLTDGTDTTGLGRPDTADELNFTSNEVTVEATFDGFAHFDTVSQLLFIDKDHTISSPQSWGQVNRSNSGWIETPSTTTTWNQTTSNSTPWQ